MNVPNGSGKDLRIQQTAGTTQVNFDLQFINLPDGATLTVWSEQFQSVVPFGSTTNVVIGTLTVTLRKVSEAIDYAGFVSGNIDGLLITQPNGAILLHANRFN